MWCGCAKGACQSQRNPKWQKRWDRLDGGANGRAECLRASPTFFCHVAPSCIAVCLVWPWFTGFYWVFPCFTRFYWVLLGFTEFYRLFRVFLDLIRFYRTLLDYADWYGIVGGQQVYLSFAASVATRCAPWTNRGGPPSLLMKCRPVTSS